MTYNERVRVLAEKMARDDIAEYSLKKIDDGTAKSGGSIMMYYNERIAANMEKSRIAVAHMAEVAKWAYKQGAFDVRSGLHGDLIDADLYCKTEGLIPDSAQEGQES